MPDGQPITSYLAEIKDDGRSSPAGRSWEKFRKWLEQAGPKDARKLPVPLILAASGDSNAMKHRRLADQLRWAEEYGLLEQALEQLRAIPLDMWSHGSPDDWNRTSHAWE